MENRCMSTLFNNFTQAQLNAFLVKRVGETKLGESISIPLEDETYHDALSRFTGKFVVLGIPEDIGPRANCGKPGCSETWEAFLKAFLNIQDNDFIQASEILVLGNVHTHDLQEAAKKDTHLEYLGELIEQLDQRVTQVVSSIFASQKTPVIVGGGHNNVYPILRGLNQYLKAETGVINIDPHADVREISYRHSGNGFSAAMLEGFLDKYALIGMHEGYNNQHILDFIKEKKEAFFTLSFEQLLDRGFDAKQIRKEAQQFLAATRTGLELDLDSIAYLNSSAATPSGFSEWQVRQLIRQISRKVKPCYLHISEGIASENNLVGKLISYFVQDFIKSVPNHG